jgi:predicted dehydrogenase
MSHRRAFLGTMLAGATATATSVAVSCQVGSRRVEGSNERIRIGLIGGGARGKEILGAAVGCPGVEAVGVADAYTRRLDEVKSLVPAIATFQDHRKLLEDRGIDAVLIATPQHLHAAHFIAAIEAGKDVYQEKTMAFSPAHARRMRKALDGSGRIVQVGMQMNSGPGIQGVRELATSGRVGQITAIQTHHFRNASYGGWLRAIPVDCDRRHLDWCAFEGDAKAHPFDPERFINWRFFWDYSGGNVFENMVHAVGFWYGALDLGIPESVTMTGGNYRSPRMQVPDTMNVAMCQRERILFTWTSMFGNDYHGEMDDFLYGTKGTLIHTAADQVRYVPQGERNPPPSRAGKQGGDAELTGHHMRNFFDCVRNRNQPNCPFELGFRTSIACQMAIASYRRQSPVRWDPATEEIF